jgi:hypothetical protein
LDCKDYALLGGKCDSCGMSNHHFGRCPLISFIPDKYKVVKYEIKKINQRVPKQRKIRDYRTFHNLENTVQKAIDVFDKYELFLMNRSWILSDPSDLSDSEYQSDDAQNHQNN